LKIQSCRFERSAHGPEQEPAAPGPGVVFLGRSNVGKSSLINKLLGVRGLAQTSSRPGRTRSVNFYRINEWFQFIDLPGYGYAKVPKAEQEKWGPMVEGFLTRRAGSIGLALLIVDARHEPRALDRTMRDWLEHNEIRYIVTATKADKLSGNARTRTMRALRQEFEREDRPTILVSSQTGLGIPEVWKRLDRVLKRGERTQEG
jgi:GTP-binding protein